MEEFSIRLVLNLNALCTLSSNFDQCKFGQLTGE